ncbi:hypothetical protein ANN_05810 [Periplaneta americana]|uniref:Alpha 1,4-glycosyltransferase domain-containing protein n=1 Tax=Periplaneta americana TaxID=6978 RepID=A0ABQ8TD46_PERAM|nr:hypothetical protein ANN_05810 [Periplaneta americana]
MKLQRAHNLCVRFVSNVRKYDHITPSLEAIGWLKLDKKRNLHSLLFLFEILNSSIPSYLSSRFTYLSSHHNLNTRSRHETILTIPSHRTSSYSSSFTIAMRRLWNSLPASISDCRNKIQFKRKLTRHLVRVMKRRLKHKIIFVCALVFVLWINSFLYSHYQEARNDSTHEEVYNFPDIEMEPIRGRKNIIFLETLCAISPNEISSTGLLLTKRQACSIESAAKWNPSSTVHLLYTCSMNGGMEVTSSYIRQLFKYPNVKIWKLDIPEFLKGTPLEGWDFHGELELCTSMAARTWTWMSSLEELGGNYVGKENPQTLSSCVLSMSAEVIGHEVAKLCVEDTLKDFDGGSWNHNGTDLITKVLKQVCGVDKVSLNHSVPSNTAKLVKYQIRRTCMACYYTRSIVEKMSPETCRGFKILSTEVFTPIFYYQWKMLFRSTEIQEVMDLMNLSYGVHMWNFLSNEGNVNLLIQQPYGLLASHHCPLVYSNSDISF